MAGKLFEELAVGQVFQPLLWMGACLAAAALAGQLGSTRLGISFHKLAPDPQRLNPLQKLRSVPLQNAASCLQAMVFLPLLALAVWKIASENQSAYAGLARQGLAPALEIVTGSLKDFLWKAAFLFLVIGCLDFLRVRHRHMQSLRMSKLEVRDELKDTEGNPQIKARVRRIQRDLARRNMMKEIPKATAVVVNPTHYSVAIRYEMETMAAPRVLAKGKNYLALRIRHRDLAGLHRRTIGQNGAGAALAKAAAEFCRRQAEAAQHIEQRLVGVG